MHFLAPKSSSVWELAFWSLSRLQFGEWWFLNLWDYPPHTHCSVWSCVFHIWGMLWHTVKINSKLLVFERKQCVCEFVNHMPCCETPSFSTCMHWMYSSNLVYISRCWQLGNDLSVLSLFLSLTISFSLEREA